MTRTNLVARSLNDLGTAAWFGGVLMGATAANRAPADIADEADRGRVVNGVWRRWWPVNALAVGAHLAGGTLLTIGNRERVVAQRGVATLSTVKAALTSPPWARRPTPAGSASASPTPAPSPSSTAPRRPTPHRTAVASALRQQRLLQWAIPALTGVLIVLNAAQGEQQRPSTSLAACSVA